MDEILRHASPNNIHEFLGNVETGNQVSQFLASPKCASFLLIGPSGSGKTTFCKLLLKEHADRYCTFRPTFEDFHSHKDFKNTVDKFLFTKNMMEIFQNKKKILFLDDVDVILTTDRYANTYIQEILKIAKERMDFKILMTCSQGNEKRVTDLKKKTLYAFLKNPQTLETIGMLRRLAMLYQPTTVGQLGKDNASAPIFDEPMIYARQIHDFCEMHCNNIRSCAMNLPMLLQLKINQAHPITPNEYDQQHVVFDKNIIDIVTSIMAAKRWSVRSLDIWLSVDPCLVSYIMYDNVTSIITKSFQLQRVVGCFALSSIIESTVYARNDTMLNDICNIWRCGVIKDVLTGLENGVVGKTLKYTTITTRCSNHYSAVKKNATTCNQLWLSRSDMLWGCSTGIIKDDDSLKTFTKKLVNKEKHTKAPAHKIELFLGVE